MKDPLDCRSDAYQIINAEADRQGEDLMVTLETKPREVRNICSILEENVEDQGSWHTLSDRVTQPALRVREDIFYYFVNDNNASGQTLPEPTWTYEPLPVPELPLDAGVLQIVMGDPQRLYEPVKLRQVALNPLTRYDEVATPAFGVTFEI
jgi:hypothetical protein